MTKTEFLEKRKKISSQMDVLQQKEKDLLVEYGKSNTAVELGTKVKCYRYDGIYKGIGCLAAIRVNKWDGGISYEIDKIKKDGTMSKISAGWYCITRIEPVED